MKNRLVKLALAGMLIATGCDEQPVVQYQKTSIGELKSSVERINTNNSPMLGNNSSIEYVTIEGIPLSASYRVKQDRPDFLTFVISDNKTPILATLKSVDYEKGIRAEALIQSEINDGDDEPIQVRGVYDIHTKEITPNRITANGYTIEF